MKKIIEKMKVGFWLLAIASIFLIPFARHPGIALGANGDINPLNTWTATTTPLQGITQRVPGANVIITGLPDGCLGVTSGLVGSSGSSCGTGTGTSTGGQLSHETVTGTIDGSNTSFSIAATFSGASFIDLNGQILTQDVDYTVSGTSVTYTSPPGLDLAGTTNVIYYGAGSGGGGGSSVNWTFDATPTGTVNGVNQSFTLPVTPTQVVVYADGTHEKGGGVDYSWSGTGITFVAGHQPFSTISVDYKTGSSSWTFDSTPSGSVNGSNLTFTLAVSPTQAIIYADGLRMKGGGVDYTRSGATITFNSGEAPATSILADYLP